MTLTQCVGRWLSSHFSLFGNIMRQWCRLLEDWWWGLNVVVVQGFAGAPKVGNSGKRLSTVRHVKPWQPKVEMILSSYTSRIADEWPWFVSLKPKLGKDSNPLIYLVGGDGGGWMFEDAMSEKKVTNSRKFMQVGWWDTFEISLKRKSSSGNAVQLRRVGLGEQQWESTRHWVP